MNQKEMDERMRRTAGGIRRKDPGDLKGLLSLDELPLEQANNHSGKNIQNVELEKLLDNPYQKMSRDEIKPEDVVELADSIRSTGFYGMLKARPSRSREGYFELAYGHRRREAAREAGLKVLPVEIEAISDEQMLLIMTSENLSREDIKLYSEVMLVGYWLDDHNQGARQTGQKIGKGESWVLRRYQIFQAHDLVKESIRAEKIGFRQALALSEVKDESLVIILLKEVINEELTEKQLISRRTNLLNPTIKGEELAMKPEQNRTANQNNQFASVPK